MTQLYWDFMARNADRLKDNRRMRNQLATLRRLDDLDEVRRGARRVKRALREGRPVADPS